MNCLGIIDIRKALDLFCLGLSRGPPLITCEFWKMLNRKHIVIMKALDLFCLGLSRGPPLITREFGKR